ncbi:DUF3592 domain-containing protein [Specibacter sp. NPDC057265]|uniref:DUF3592 domain-containing protein n=1 Tax=Specibacter sp. NPDC057265 TaxID=3346075 RepID=UPI003628A720
MRTTLRDQAREQSAATPFLPPEGWTRSPRKSTSRFAFEMSRTTNWYRNDGQGTGYFAPGWNSERIAKRAGILRWVGLGLAVLVLVFPAVFLPAQYAEQFRYNHLKSQGVVTSAVVQSVEVEKFVEHRRKTAAKYVTETTAVVAYPVNGQMAEAQIKDRDQEQSNLTSSAQHPPPAWKSGDTVQGYADPKNPGDFAVIDRIKEADSDSLPRGAILTLCFTALFLALPVVLIIAGSRNVKRARQL